MSLRLSIFHVWNCRIWWGSCQGHFTDVVAICSLKVTCFSGQCSFLTLSNLCVVDALRIALVLLPADTSKKPVLAKQLSLSIEKPTDAPAAEEEPPVDVLPTPSAKEVENALEADMKAWKDGASIKVTSSPSLPEVVASLVACKPLTHLARLGEAVEKRANIWLYSSQQLSRIADLWHPIPSPRLCPPAHHFPGSQHYR